MSGEKKMKVHKVMTRRKGTLGNEKRKSCGTLGNSYRKRSGTLGNDKWKKRYITQWQEKAYLAETKENVEAITRRGTLGMTRRSPFGSIKRKWRGS